MPGCCHELRGGRATPCRAHMREAGGRETQLATCVLSYEEEDTCLSERREGGRRSWQPVYCHMRRRIHACQRGGREGDAVGNLLRLVHLVVVLDDGEGRGSRCGESDSSDPFAGAVRCS
jgi:hypothetical protein